MKTKISQVCPTAWAILKKTFFDSAIARYGECSACPIEPSGWDFHMNNFLVKNVIREQINKTSKVLSVLQLLSPIVTVVGSDLQLPRY